MVPHLTIAHSVSPQATSHALLMWILTSNQMKKQQNMIQHQTPKLDPMQSAMLLQSMLPNLKAPQVPPLSMPNNRSSPIAVATPPITARATPPSSNPTPPLQQIMPPTSSSFLQSLLNGDPPRPPIHMSNPTPHHHQQQAAPPPAPSLSAGIDMSKLEHVVTKLTRKHMGLNSRESYQCQVCSKWFAVPPIKHLRGHLVTFKEEQRPYIGLINNNGYACLACYFIANSPHEITEHMTLAHSHHNNHHHHHR